MKVLVTGGFGYLGGRVAQFLAQSTQDEILLGTRIHANPPSWLPQAGVVSTRWNAPTQLLEISAGVDVIVHLAGMNAQDCVDDPVSALEINALATARLLQAAVGSGVKRFIYVSTAHVYGNPLVGTITEETCPVSLHPYATSHRAGEDAVRRAHRQVAIEGIVIRLSNAFGAPVHKEANCWMLLVNDLCRQAVTTGRMVLQTSGTQRRDFIALTDACRAIGHLLRLPVEKLGDGLFNVGGAWAPTILEMTQHVAARIHVVTGNRPEILRKEDPQTESSEILDYGMKKLIGTGFSVNGSGVIDREIDALIRFCLEDSG